MILPEPLPNENERLAALYRQDILDTQPESEFDTLVEMTAQLCEAEIVLISLVDDRRQWFKSCIGLEAKETPKQISFCAHAIHSDDIFEIPDATLDPRFYDNPLVTGEPYIRFYAGQPINSPEGYKLGTLCLIGSKPRQLNPNQRRFLRLLAQQVERQLTLRRHTKLLNRSLKTIQEQADTLAMGNHIRDQLLAVLSHDLRNPVANLENIIASFEQDYLSAEVLAELITAVRPDLNKAVNQLNEVLGWAQRQIQTDISQMQLFSVRAIADKSVTWVIDRVQKKAITLDLDIADNLWAIGNPDLVHIVWRNLLTNAVKYSQAGDRVTIFAKRQGDNAIFGVRDTGLGMSAATLEKLRLGQNKVSTLGTDQEVGTGLGLLLCRTYLQQMHSHLHIESTLGQGSTFSFELAIAEP